MKGKCATGFRVTTLVFLMLGLAALFGCGRKASIPLVKVRGQLMYKGQPVPDVTVTLVPQEKQRAATGKTDAQGRFTVGTLAPGDGAMPGKYKIILTKTAAVEAAPQAAELPDITQEGKVAAPPSVGAGIPAKYTSPATTPLTCEIPPSGSHDLGVLELTD